MSKKIEDNRSELRNVGTCNTGDQNVGSKNSGHRNHGDGNTGIGNFGSFNSGNFNQGDWNSGIRNRGDWNSGDHNIGYGNAGDWNRTSYSCGCFNTIEPKMYFFNRPSSWTHEDWEKSEARIILMGMWESPTDWVEEEYITEAEKKQKTHETTGGYLRVYERRGRKVLDRVPNANEWWKNLDERSKDIIRALPNFDVEIFKQITGITEDIGG